MTVAPHPTAPRWAPFIALAFVAIVAASLLVIVDWAVAVPNEVSNAAPAGTSSGPATQALDTDLQFYKEKTMAPAHELPAQF